MLGAQAPGGVGKVKRRNPAVYVADKSDTSVVPEKPSNEGPGPAEMVEERDVAKGNTDTSPIVSQEVVQEILRLLGSLFMGGYRLGVPIHHRGGAEASRWFGFGRSFKSMKGPSPWQSLRLTRACVANEAQVSSVAEDCCFTTFGCIGTLSAL